MHSKSALVAVIQTAVARTADARVQDKGLPSRKSVRRIHRVRRGVRTLCEIIFATLEHKPPDEGGLGGHALEILSVEDS